MAASPPRVSDTAGRKLAPVQFCSRTLPPELDPQLSLYLLITLNLLFCTVSAVQARLQAFTPHFLRKNSLAALLFLVL